MGHERAFITDPLTLEQATVRSHGLDVNVQDQTSPLLARHFGRVLNGPLPLFADWLQDTYTLQMAIGHGITAGSNIIIFDGVDAMELYVVSVSPMGVYDDIRVDTLADKTFEATGDNAAEIDLVDFDLNVDGSTTPVSFRFPSTDCLTVLDQRIDVTNLNLDIRTGSATLPDDGLFGGIAALTRGVIGRYHGVIQSRHLATFRTNGEMAAVGTVEYTDSAPSGTTGVRVNFKLGGQQNAGVVIRVEPAEYIEIIVQDDLTGMDYFQMIALAHVVVD